MYELKVMNSSGFILDLTGNKNYTVYKIDGLAPTKATINTSVNATQDGGKVNSSRVEFKNIVLYITIEGDIETNRLQLYKYFLPKSNVTLHFKNGARDVSISGVVEIIECDLFSKRQIVQVSIICPTPYFKAVDELVSKFSDVTKLFEFPFSIASAGVELSTITTNVRKTIIYAGDVESGMVIELYAIGDVVNPIVYDAIRRTHIKLTFSMQQGDKLIINTDNRSITLVRAGVETNALGYLYPDSTWLTLAPGDNVFTYACDSGSSNLQLKFTTPILYGGV